VKNALSWDEYEAICKQFYESGNVKAHCILTLAWNLCSRIDNVLRLRVDDLSFSKDYLGVRISKTKTDPTGQNARTIHVYANPLNHVVCPLFALGMYLLCSERAATQILLFPDTEYMDFLKALKDAASQVGSINVECVGTISTRKGAATFAAGGNVPTAVSLVAQRGGWSFGNVMDRYIAPSDEGDCYIGRILCGLPRDDVAFATLPPQLEMDAIGEAISALYDLHKSPEGMKNVVAAAIASVIAQSGQLERDKNKLGESHKYFSSLVYKNCSVYQKLLLNPPSRMCATGVPKLVHIIAEVREKLQELSEQVRILKHEGLLAGLKIRIST